MAAEVKETKRDPISDELRKAYLDKKASYEAMWQTQLDTWEAPPPVPKFEELVGTENFISENDLTRIRSAGEGSFATGPCTLKQWAVSGGMHAHTYVAGWLAAQRL